ncbi:MAG: PAS domain S-box protein [Desulfatibacillaceae bacterium]
MERTEVLIIEDSPLDARVVREMLDREKTDAFSFSMAESLAQAEAAIRNQPPDIVMLDLNLPDSRGLSTFRRLQGQAPRTPILVLSGTEDERTAVDCVREGAQAYLIKGKVSGGSLARSIQYAMERQRTANALSDSENRYRRIFRNIQDVYFEASVDGTILEMSPSVLEVCGYDRDELVDRPLSNILETASFRAVLHRLYMEHTVRDWEVALLDRSGSVRAASLNASLIEGEKAGQDRVVGSLRDITDRKEAEHALTRRLWLEGALSQCSKILLEDSDMALEQAMETAARAGGLESACVFTNTDEQHLGQCMSKTGAWRRKKPGPRDKGRACYLVAPYEPGYSDWRRELAQGSPVKLSCGELSGETLSLLEADNCNSLLLVPIIVKSRWTGFIAYGRQGDQWPTEAVQWLETVSEMMGTYLVRKKAEEENLFQAQLLDAVEQAVAAADADGNIIFWNRFAEVLFKWSAPEVMGRKLPDVFMTHDRQRQMFAVMEQIRRGDSFTGELDVRRRDNTTFPAMLHGSGIQGERGDLAGFVLISEDCTPRRRINEALREAYAELDLRVQERTAELVEANRKLREQVEERKAAETRLEHSRNMLQTVFDGIAHPLVMVDSDMTVRMLNRSAMDYYGTGRPEQVLGSVCHAGMLGRDEPCSGCSVPDVVRAGVSSEFERVSPLDPACYEQIVIYPIRDERTLEPGAIISITDITEARLIQQQLIQNEKLASLGLLVSGIAHEINNPNNFITFNVPIMRDYLREIMPYLDLQAESGPIEIAGMPYEEFQEDAFKLLENIEYGASRINTIVGDLREFARIEDTRREVLVDLRAEIEKGLSLCENQIKKHVRHLAVDIPDGLPPIRTNPKAIEQVVINLLINAAQAADKKDSRIELGVEYTDGAQRQVVIQVEDNGMGMDEKARARIFDPFFTSKAPGEGTGLGLYVSQNLIGGIGGRIEVESEPGRGSRFRVVLPVPQVDDAETEALGPVTE